MTKSEESWTQREDIQQKEAGWSLATGTHTHAQKTFRSSAAELPPHTEQACRWGGSEGESFVKSTQTCTHSPGGHRRVGLHKKWHLSYTVTHLSFKHHIRQAQEHSVTDKDATENKGESVTCWWSGVFTHWQKWPLFSSKGHNSIKVSKC